MCRTKCVRALTGAKHGFGAVAQLGEHLLCKQGVIGSNPFSSTIVAEIGTVAKPWSRAEL